MNETAGIVEKLGAFGLRERLSEEDLKEGLDNFDLIAELKNSEPDYSDSRPEARAYIGDDYVPRVEVYNALGAIYPSLSKEQRTNGLRTILRKIDVIRYDRVSMNHTPYIRDPQLLSDIGASRILYWPGLRDEEHLLKGKNDFKDLRKEIMDEKGLFKVDKVTSDFLVAYAILRSDFTSFGEEYSQAAHPEFIKRVLKGIVALRFGTSKSNEDIEEGRARLQKILPRSLHEQIDSMREEADWNVITGVIR